VTISNDILAHVTLKTLFFPRTVDLSDFVFFSESVFCLLAFILFYFSVYSISIRFYIK